ncbi:MAG: sensor histidine kinase [Bdellovibrionota bacterium]
MSDLIRTRDWSATSFGPISKWPACLKMSLELCLASAFPSAVCWGSDLRLLFNDAYADLMPGEEGPALGAPFLKFWGRLRGETEGLLRKVLTTGETVQVQDMRTVITRGPHQGEKFFHLSYCPIWSESGKVAGVFAVAIDSTAKVQSERRLLEEQAKMERAFSERTDELTRSRAFLDSLIENLPNMVFVKDAKNLRFVRFNKAGEDLLGFSRETLIGKNDFDFFPPEQAKTFTDKDRSVLAGREIVDIPEEPISTKTKGTRFLHTRKIPVFGTDGSPEYLLGISDDITEKLEADKERLRISREQAALEEREAAGRRVALLANASVALSTSLDFHATLQKLAALVVPAIADWCTITVRTEGETLSRVAALHADPSKALLMEELQRDYPPNRNARGLGPTQELLDRKSQFLPVISEHDLELAAQSPRHLELLKLLGSTSGLVVPITGREIVHGAIALLSGDSGRKYGPDELRMAEELGRRAGSAIDNALLYLEAQRAVASRDAFLSIASHELKTPLTSLTIQAQLRRRQLDRGQFDSFSPFNLIRMVESDARQLDRLNRLIDDMLDISRIASGKLTVNFEPVNLTQLLREAADRQVDQFGKAGCELTISGDEHAVGLWDRFRIEQVITNLLTNAMKYGAGCPVHASVRVEGANAILEVADHGIGIAAADQERIFRQFERAVGPGEASGLGLGLYIVKQILELHRGSISVESELGKGSRFIVSLPIATTNSSLS